jgi:hypothetical protein
MPCPEPADRAIPRYPETAPPGTPLTEQECHALTELAGNGCAESAMLAAATLKLLRRIELLERQTYL